MQQQHSFRNSTIKGFTSTQRHDVLQPKPLGLLQMPCDIIPSLTAACHVQDGLQATVVDCSVGNNHGRGFLVRSRIPCRVPGHINEEWTTCSHAVKPVDFRAALAYQAANSPLYAWGILLNVGTLATGRGSLDDSSRRD